MNFKRRRQRDKDLQVFYEQMKMIHLGRKTGSAEQTNEQFFGNRKANWTCLHLQISLGIMKQLRKTKL